jgi:hypothetical protein
MDDRKPESDPEHATPEESAVVRGWLRLADDVLKQPTAQAVEESDQPA